jgi:hypothetical protein
MGQGVGLDLKPLGIDDAREHAPNHVHDDQREEHVPRE